MKSKWLLLLLPILCASILFARLSSRMSSPFEWDRLGYYSYLPAIFIYHDLGRLSFYPEVIQRYQLAGYEHWYATYPQPEGKRLNKYAVGTSLFQMPFFLAAHAYAALSGHFPADGFSLPYQYAAGFSTVFWMALGLFYLRRSLQPYFNDFVIFFTLVCIGLGTNLFDYTVISIGMSHPYSFFLFAALLYHTDTLYVSGRSRHVAIVALLMGLIAIVRPVNMVVGIIPLLWKANTRSLLVERVSFLRRKRTALLISILLFVAIIAIQLVYWKYATGKWLYFSYQGEGFDFLRPQIWKGLFSWRKGWFIYTPIAFIGIVGIYNLWRRDRSTAPALILFFIVIIFMVFSWWNWYYGGTFGCRPLIETLAILSLPLAAFIADVQTSTRSLRFAGYSLLICLVVLNLFQTYQHSKNIIHYDRMTAAYYWKVFGKIEYDPNVRQYLMTEEEYVRDFEELKNSN